MVQRCFPSCVDLPLLLWNTPGSLCWYTGVRGEAARGCQVGRGCGAAWGCPLRLPEPLCSESVLRGWEGGYDPGYSFHIRFKFLSIYQLSVLSPSSWAPFVGEPSFLSWRLNHPSEIWCYAERRAQFWKGRLGGWIQSDMLAWCFWADLAYF